MMSAGRLPCCWLRGGCPGCSYSTSYVARGMKLQMVVLYTVWLFGACSSSGDQDGPRSRVAVSLRVSSKLKGFAKTVLARIR